MFHIRSFPDFLSFYSTLKRLYGLERRFRSNAARADQTVEQYRKELIKGLTLAESFLPRLCNRPGRRTASSLLKIIDRSGGKMGLSFELSSANSAFKVIAGEAFGAGAKVFPISGTLLGLVREGRLLQHDYDLDFGIMDEDKEGYWGLIERLQSHPEIEFIQASPPEPLTVYLNPELRHATRIPQKTKIRFRSGVLVDLASHFSYRGQRLHASEVNLWSHEDFEISESTLLGVTSYLPKVPEQYLEENYGDWRTPAKDYVYFLDTPNWAPIISALALRMYVGNGLRFAAQGQHQKVKRTVEQCLAAFKKRVIESS